MGCRLQHNEAKADTPCDTPAGCPYTPSPGDKGENGCGLAAENEVAIWLYPRYKRFGRLAMELADLELKKWEGDLLLDKLMMIEDHVPYITQAQDKRAETKQKVRGRRKRK